MTTSLADARDLERAIRASWCIETCDPVDRLYWDASNPSRGQCGVTALVVHDELGGDLLVAEVHHADGSRQGVHYWNRLTDATEVDLTREQFKAGEQIGPPRTVPRPPSSEAGRLASQYAHLRAAVDRALTVRD